MHRKNKPYLSLHSSEHYASLRRAREPAFYNSPPPALSSGTSDSTDISQRDAEDGVKGDVWNFNVSHHGRYTCIAAHDECLVSDRFLTHTRGPDIFVTEIYLFTIT